MKIVSPYSTSHSEAVLHAWADIVRKALEFIDRSLSEQLTVKIVSAQVGMSASQLRMVFPWFVGEGIGEYVRRRRLEKAAFTINLTDQPLTQVALDAGFESPAAFSRSFKKLFGVSPRGYRKKQPPPIAGPHRRALRNGIPAEVSVTESPSWSMVYRPMVGGNNHTVARAAVELLRWAEKKNLTPNPSKVVVRTFDDEGITSDANTRYDVGVQLKRPVAEEEGFAVQQIPSRLVASAPFHGDGASHSQAWWDFGINWMMQSGYDYAELASYDFIDVKPRWLENIPSLLSSALKQNWKYHTKMEIPIRHGAAGSLAAPFPPPIHESIS